MSDISTSLSMNGGQLFTQNELLTCSMFNLKMFLFVLTILICISCICMSINPITLSLQSESKSKENFSNNLFFSDKDTMNPGYSNYQSTPLTSNINSLIFGQANRYINTNKDSITQLNYILDVYANLYVINGNPFGSISESFNQKYAVYLKNTETLEKLEIGKLKKDGDGMYKIHFVSSEPSKYMHFNEVEIIYETSESKIILLQGKLTIA